MSIDAIQLAAPHGLRGYAAPVEQVVPALVPFIELEDGRRIVAGDGADEIEPAPDGRSIRARWRKWAQIGSKPGQLVDPGVQSDVEWRLDGGVLTRTERLTATVPVRIKRWSVVVPSTAGQWSAPPNRLAASTFLGPEGNLTVQPVQADWPVTMSVNATGDAMTGRGARMAIPLNLTYEAAGIDLQPGKPVTWSISIASERRTDVVSRVTAEGQR